MKLRNIEIALATLTLIFIFYKLFASIDGYIAGRFSDAAYGREMFVAKGLQFNFWINYFIPPLLKWFPSTHLSSGRHVPYQTSL